MDLLIKNMKMPQKGHFLFQISANGDVWVSNRNDEGTGIIIAKAIELPPHGRLGDLDFLSETIDSSVFWDTSDYSLIRDIVKNVPTVLEATE